MPDIPFRYLEICVGNRQKFNFPEERDITFEYHFQY